MFRAILLASWLGGLLSYRIPTIAVIGAHTARGKQMVNYALENYMMVYAIAPTDELLNQTKAIPLNATQFLKHQITYDRIFILTECLRSSACAYIESFFSTSSVVRIDTDDVEDEINRIFGDLM
tara:strand:- start:31 stop:402 length:372 start_codon:yes stop_codon:yes gene_type:complete